MTIFNFISLFGGLALFLYGMQLMGDGLKKGSSDALKAAMEKVTNNPLVGFLLGLAVTAVIQSSTATIVLTSGLVGAGVLTLHQSIGIILGANVGTTITGQIIRLLDLNADGGAWLNLFKPSTLAPLCKGRRGRERTDRRRHVKQAREENAEAHRDAADGVAVLRFDRHDEKNARNGGKRCERGGLE